MTPTPPAGAPDPAALQAEIDQLTAQLAEARAGQPAAAGVGGAPPAPDAAAISAAGELVGKTVVHRFDDQIDGEVEQWGVVVEQARDEEGALTPNVRVAWYGGLSGPMAAADLEAHQT